MEKTLARIEILVEMYTYIARVETQAHGPREYRHRDFETALEQVWRDLEEEFGSI